MTQSHETPQHVPQNYERMEAFFEHLPVAEQRRLIAGTASESIKTQFEMNGQPEECEAFLILMAQKYQKEIFFDSLSPAEKRQLVSRTAPDELWSRFEIYGQYHELNEFLNNKVWPFLSLLAPHQRLQGDADHNPRQAILELNDYQILQGAE